MKWKWLAFASCIVSIATHGAVAQERTATGSIDTQVTWSALQGQIQRVDIKAEAAQTLAEAVKACGIKGMIYSPETAGADANGCKTAVRVSTQTVSCSMTDASGCTATCPAGSTVTGGGMAFGASWGLIREGLGAGGTSSVPQGNGWYCARSVNACSSGSMSNLCGSRCFATCLTVTPNI